jgi:hypothetical protein
MERIFLAVAVIALAGLAASLFFPPVPIAPREVQGDDGPTGGRQSLPNL